MAGKMGGRKPLTGDEIRHAFRKAVAPDHRNEGNLMSLSQSPAQIDGGVEHITGKADAGRTVRPGQRHLDHRLSDTGDLHAQPPKQISLLSADATCSAMADLPFV
jgi:hypothetical protein